MDRSTPIDARRSALDAQLVIDAEHLRLLRIGYFISAGYTGFFVLLGLFYASMAFMFGSVFRHVPHPRNGLPPEWLASLFGVVGFGIAGLASTVAALKLRAATCLGARRSHGFCVVMGVLTCLEVPYGTALGVFTIVVLNRPSVKALFEARYER